MFHRVCPAEHGNLYGEKPNIRTDGPATSIGTDLPGVFRTDCLQTVSCRHLTCSGGAAAKNPATLTGRLWNPCAKPPFLRTNCESFQFRAQIRRFCAPITFVWNGFTPDTLDETLPSSPAKPTRNPTTQKNWSSPSRKTPEGKADYTQVRDDIQYAITSGNVDTPVELKK